MIQSDQSNIWKLIVEKASEFHGRPYEFWKKIQQLLGRKNNSTLFLEETINNDSDSEDSSY